MQTSSAHALRIMMYVVMASINIVGILCIRIQTKRVNYNSVYLQGRKLAIFDGRRMYNLSMWFVH